jgi:AraC-like DNA-binding protein
MALNGFQLAALLGSAQGFLLAGVLAVQERNRTGNRLLSVAMVAFSIYLITVVYHAVQFEQVWPHFFGVAYPLPLLYGPLVYLYAVTTSDRTRHLRRRDALHFIPFAATVIAGFPIYAMSGPEKIAFYHELQQGVRPAVVRVIDPLKLISGVSYAVATIVFLRRHQSRMKDSYSSLERVNLRWLLRLAAAAAAIWGLAATLDLTERFHHPLVRQGDDVVALAVAILVYGIGYMALRQPEIFNFSASEHRAAEPLIHDAATLPLAPPSGDKTARYERSGLGEPEARVLEKRLLALMDGERPYQDSELSLNDLARRLDTTPHKLSEVLNSELGQSFYDFVNAYRVRDVQRRIADGQSKNLTILSLAVDAGFTSKSTFNQVFKRHTGQTPSEYRKSVGE